MLDSTIHCFINQGFKGTHNVGYKLDEIGDESLLNSPEQLDRFSRNEKEHNPFAERHTNFFATATPTKNIEAGEELLVSTAI